MTEEIRNAYQTLELPNGANLPQVQKARRKMAMVWHPDRVAHNPDLQRQAEERTKQINNAYDILKRYLIDGDIPRSRPRPSTQSQKQESQKQTRQQNTASEDAQSSQTDERENRQKQTTKPFQEKSLDAKIGGIIRIIFVIIFSAIIGHFTGRAIVSLLDWMIEAVSGWSFIDRANLWSEIFPSKTLIIVPLIATFIYIIDIAEDEDWIGYTFFGVCGGTIGGMIGGIIGNEIGIAGIATYIGVVLGVCLGCVIVSILNDELKREK